MAQHDTTWKEGKVKEANWKSTDHIIILYPSYDPWAQGSSQDSYICASLYNISITKDRVRTALQEDHSK